MTRATRRGPTRHAGSAGVLGLMLCTGLAPALARADPMRPLVAPAGAPAPAAALPAAAASAAPAAERLVAIRRDSARRWLALVGERWVTVGDRVEGLVVSDIDGNAVSLADRAGGHVRRTLHLLPVLVPMPVPMPVPMRLPEATGPDPEPARAVAAGRTSANAPGPLNP